MLLIENATNVWTKSWFIFTRTTSEKSAKLFSKNPVIHYALEKRNPVCAACACCNVFISYSIGPNLFIDARVSDIGCLQTTLLISCIVRVQNNQDFVQSLVAFWISNICYYAVYSTNWKNSQLDGVLKFSMTYLELTHRITYLMVLGIK